MDLSKKKIGVFLGGLSRERDVSFMSGNAVLDCLNSNGMNAVPVEVNVNIEKVISTLDIDVAFIALHGEFGEDGGIQALLEKKGIPYTGAGIEASRRWDVPAPVPCRRRVTAGTPGGEAWPRCPKLCELWPGGRITLTLMLENKRFC